MKDLILEFKLLKYGYKAKANILMILLFTGIGFAVEISSKGTDVIGGFYFMLIGMIIYQMILYMNVSDYVQTSAMKWKFSAGLPAFVSTIVYLVLLTILVVEKYVLIQKYPERTDRYLDILCMIIVLLFGVMIFCGICYKYFVVSFVVFMALVLSANVKFGTWLDMHHISSVMHIGLAKLAVLGYAVIIVGGVLEYLISRALYRKPISSIAMDGIAKGMNK